MSDVKRYHYGGEEMSTVYDDYQKRKAERETAEKWSALPAGTKYRNNTFDISPAHCHIKLVRAGQQARVRQKLLGNRGCVQWCPHSRDREPPGGHRCCN